LSDLHIPGSISIGWDVNGKIVNDILILLMNTGDLMDISWLYNG
jgi:hypothetical protein